MTNSGKPEQKMILSSRKHERTKAQKGTIFVFKELEQQNI
jgi:hypothetical protein